MEQAKEKKKRNENSNNSNRAKENVLIEKQEEKKENKYKQKALCYALRSSIQHTTSFLISFVTNRKYSVLSSVGASCYTSFFFFM